MKKRIIATVIALVLSIGFAVGAAFGAKYLPEGEKAEEKVPMYVPKPEDIQLPDKLRDEGFGLFFYNPDGTRTKIGRENLNFDPDKPTIIFIHGVQYQFGYKGDEEMSNPEGWIEAGWNAGIFMWSQFSDGFPWPVSSKVWCKDADMGFAYEKDGKRAYEMTSVLNYTLTECFTAYYLDFMAEQKFKGPEIRLAGLSLGSQMAIAVSSYLLTLEESGAIGAEYLPDRVTLHDAYLTSLADENHCEWLGNIEIGENGNSYLAIDTIKRLNARGIAVEYYQSSGLVNLPKSWVPELFETLPEITSYLEYRSDWESDMNTKHCMSKKWYLYAINDGIDYVDTADITGKSLGMSPLTPTSYVAARNGTHYKMNENMTIEGDDDVQFSVGVKHPKLAGYAFYDEDKDGNYDERLKNRLEGVKLSLYLKDASGDRLMGTTVTKRTGYYEFNVDEIYVNRDGSANYGKFYVVAEPLEGYTVTKSGDETAFSMMTNNIGSDKKSGEFVFSDKAQVKIINIGLTK